MRRNRTLPKGERGQGGGMSRLRGRKLGFRSRGMVSSLGFEPRTP